MYAERSITGIPWSQHVATVRTTQMSLSTSELSGEIMFEESASKVILATCVKRVFPNMKQVVTGIMGGGVLPSAYKLRENLCCYANH